MIPQDPAYEAKVRESFTRQGHMTTLGVAIEFVAPGENAEMEVELIQPIAMDQGLRFAIREGGRTVGSGVVTEVVE